MIQIRETTPLFFFLASPSRKDSSKEYKEQDKSVDRSARNDDRGKTCQCGSDEYEHAHERDDRRKTVRRSVSKVRSAVRVNVSRRSDLI